MQFCKLDTDKIGIFKLFEMYNIKKRNFDYRYLLDNNDLNFKTNLFK